MTATRAKHDSPARPPVLVAVSSSENAAQLVHAGKELADALGVPWEAVHIELPGADKERGARAADALGLAARNGATIATVPAASVADGIEAHLESFPAGHLVLGQSRGRRWAGLRARSVADRLEGRAAGLVLHLYPSQGGSAGNAGPGSIAPEGVDAQMRSYAYVVALVAATLLIAEALQLVTGSRSLDLLFLFPVIAVAARLGLRPALLATALSVVSYNYFLLVPAFSFDARAPQNVVMAIVLTIVAVYTAIVTNRMRGRLILSDRSARDNASIAALGQRLTRDSDWEATARTICDYVHNLLRVQTMLFREVEGVLVAAAAMPLDTLLGPVDRAALEWAWAHGEEAGAGTAVLSAADWQFQPLKTSLGQLAVLALARDDGRDPVRADQQVLLSTLVAQAALAHERLRLEDAMRASGGGAVNLSKSQAKP